MESTPFLQSVLLYRGYCAIDDWLWLYKNIYPSVLKLKKELNILHLSNLCPKIFVAAIRVVHNLERQGLLPEEK